MLDDHFAARLEEVDRVSPRGRPENQARRRGGGSCSSLRSRVGSPVLRVRRLRRPQRGLPPGARGPPPKPAGADRRALPAPGEHWAATPPYPSRTCGGDDVRHGRREALERLLEPESVSDSLFAKMLATFFAGLRARAGARPPRRLKARRSGPAAVNQEHRWRTRSSAQAAAHPAAETQREPRSSTAPPRAQPVNSRALARLRAPREAPRTNPLTRTPGTNFTSSKVQPVVSVEPVAARRAVRRRAPGRDHARRR